PCVRLVSSCTATSSTVIYTLSLHDALPILIPALIGCRSWPHEGSLFPVLQDPFSLFEQYLNWPNAGSPGKSATARLILWFESGRAYLHDQKRRDFRAERPSSLSYSQL